MVPYLRIDLMAQAIEQLLANAETRHEMGASALLKVQSRHSVELAAHQIMHQLTLLLEKAQL